MKAFFDIDTQIDFVYPAGALFTPGAGKVIPKVAALNRYAATHNIALISTTCAHGENAEEFKIWPPHCIKGTMGQTKPASTIQPGQIIIEKDELDLFTSPEVEATLARLQIDECYVYGVLTDYCVKHAIMGLLSRGKKVWLVSDAIAAHTPEGGAAVIADFQGKGGQLITSATLLQ
jgi:nicotinamidase/pyrazinamidase